MKCSHIQVNFSMEANKSTFNNGNKVNYASLYKPIHTEFVPLTTSSSSPPSASYGIIHNRHAGIQLENSCGAGRNEFK